MLFIGLGSQIGDTARGTDANQAIPIEHSNAGRVIAPVFKFAQTFEQHRYDVFTSNRNDYAAHGTTPKS
jgi:hypothetical protein